jgi:signal transduction histidine kinase
VAWATGLYNKYRDDSFLRAEFNIIILQIVFAIVLLVVVAISFNYLYENILETLISGITESLKHNQAVSGQQIFDSIQLIRTKDFFIFFTITVIVTLVFGYVVAKVTLRPTREAFKTQKRFISDVAHELRTPLAIIKTNSEVAMMNTKINPDLRDILVSNMEELTRASEIINNLLSLNSMVRPERMLFTDVNLGAIVDSVLKKIMQLAQKKDISITTKKQEPSTVWGNVTALEQVVENLIRNAINYTRPNGHIDVTIEPDYRGNIVCMVRDSGIGIAQQDLFHIFEPFYRAERSRNRESGSSGLGLTIVSELLKIHSGKIAIRSAVNKGTLVIVTLPLSKHDIKITTSSEKINEISVDFLNKT